MDIGDLNIKLRYMHLKKYKGLFKISYLQNNKHAIFCLQEYCKHSKFPFDKHQSYYKHINKRFE